MNSNMKYLSRGTYVLGDSVDHNDIVLTTKHKSAVFNFCRQSLEDGTYDLTCMEIHRNSQHCNLMNWYEAALIDR